MILEFRGQGFGVLLARAGIDYIKLNDIKVTLSCTFLRYELTFIL